MRKSKFIDDGIINATYESLEAMPEDTLGPINMSGRKVYENQGFTGKGVVVAVIDTGINPDHPEFEGKIVGGINTVGDDMNDYRDDNKHGTHCAGLICGKNTGVAKDAELLVIKALDREGGMKDPMSLVNALEYACSWKGPNKKKVDIISMSLSGTASAFGGTRVVERIEAAINACVKKGILVCCSMGNTGGKSIRYPAAFENVVAVGAVDINKKLANFSTHGDHADVCQVGVNVVSAYHEGGYISLSGTSMSTPIVAGIAALIKSKYNASNDTAIKEYKLYEALKSNTIDLGIAGTDKMFGAGFCTLNPANLNVRVFDGSPTIVINDIPHTMDTPCFIKDGRFNIPMRTFVELTGGYCEWHESTRSATFRW